MENVKKGALAVSVALLMIGCAQPQEAGREYYAAKNYSAAIEAYKQANAEEPNKPSTLKGLADAYFANRQYPEAIEWYLKTRSFNPLDTSVSCNLGTAYYRTGQYSEALAALEGSGVDPISQSSNLRDARIRAVRGGVNSSPSCSAEMMETLYDKTGRYDIAIASIKKQIDADPRQGGPFLKLASFYFKNGQYDDAVIAAKRAIDLMPHSAGAHHMLGVSYWKKKLFPQAIGSLLKARELNPKNSINALFLAKSHAALGEEVKAIEVLRRARIDERTSSVDSRTQPTSANLTIADIVVKTIEQGGSEESKKEVNLFVESVDFELARLLYLIGNYAESAEILTPLIEKATITGIGSEFEVVGGTPVIRNIEKKSPMLALRALAYRKLGKGEQSYEDARKAYELNAEEGGLAMAAVSFDREDMGGTLRYASALKGQTHARILEAVVYARGKNSERAIALLREIAVEGIDEKNRPLQEEKQVLLHTLSDIAKEQVSKAKTLEKSQQNDAALKAYADALLLSGDEAGATEIRSAMFRLASASPTVLPEEAHRHIVRGEFFVSEANFHEALSEFRKAVVFAPYVGRLYFNIALVEAKLERYAEALRHMGIYLEASPEAPDARAAKDEMIKWEILMKKPREYPLYEGSGEAAIPSTAVPPAPAGGRGSMPGR